MYVMREATFDPDKDIPDLQNQVFVVTGGSSGLGFAIICHLLKHNAAKIITLSNKEENARKAIGQLNSWGDTSRVIWQKCDLKDLRQVDQVARKLREEEKRIDALVLNAGIGINGFELTKEGLDSHFQVNMLSQLHLALMLLPTLQATAASTKTSARIMMMSSEMHRWVPKSTKFESEKELTENIGPTYLYGRSKLAQILIVRELARRLDEGKLGSPSYDPATNMPRPVLVNATHPGAVRTAQPFQLEIAYGWIGKVLANVFWPAFVDPIKTGCRSGVFAVTGKDLYEGSGIHGQYIVPDKKIGQPNSKGQDREMGERLWRISLQILGDRLGALNYGFETNSTVTTGLFSPQPHTYWGQFDEISKYNVHLNVAERMWAAWYAYMQNDVLATGIMSFVMHEMVYFGRSLPWMIADRLPGLNKYKIQNQKIPTAAEQWNCAKLVLLSHFTVELPQIWLFHPLAQYCGLSTTVPFPSILTMAYQIAIFFVMEDTWHYWSHRALHTPKLYKMIHKIHHQYSAPFGLAAEYASPIEVLLLGFGTVVCPIIWCAITHDLHILTMYLWIVLRLFQAIDAHSGYEFPWSLHHILPFWAGADHHDVHHEKFIGNYSSSFRWWDLACGTESGSAAAEKRRAARKAQAKKVT
ncbi:hypothetical protein EPUS_02305 [Endocarpon pusillum Z07020]|uniref:Fatty acid hydroxylase domain-containing protein n=1 Tax=Endocarpon pusillum (strain Z07020 / HMAS-L-300199) TaxID=1263415 RepID=U1GXC1_ENDPU|nr:uncharacterized protein EPUS_02305 [Endocarpon pusillum Z07020]ERF76766.1 hypothetical protein EPUS_02305 [Endocarpon pusillum Z07020]